MKTQFISRTYLLAVDLVLVDPGMNASVRIADRLSEFVTNRSAAMEHEARLRDHSGKAQRFDYAANDCRCPQLGTRPDRRDGGAEAIEADHDLTKCAKSRRTGESEVVDDGAGKRGEEDGVK